MLWASWCRECLVCICQHSGVLLLSRALWRILLVIGFYNQILNHFLCFVRRYALLVLLITQGTNGCNIQFCKLNFVTFLHLATISFDLVIVRQVNVLLCFGGGAYSLKLNGLHFMRLFGLHWSLGWWWWHNGAIGSLLLLKYLIHYLFHLLQLFLILYC